MSSWIMTDSEIIAKDLSSTSAIESQQLQIVPGGISLLDKARKIQGGEEWSSKRWSGILCEGFH